MELYLNIPETDLKVCRIGLGTANAGLSGSGEGTGRLLDAYLGLGGNLIDTARVYSDWVKPETGRSERVIGDWLRSRGRHDDAVLLTKGGHPRLDSMGVGRLSREEMQSDLDLSLKALSVDCIDIYCYHRDDAKRPVEELVETMEGFRRAGKIRYYACSNWTVGRMREADAYCRKMGYRGFVLNEALYNYGSDDMKPMADPTLAVAGGEMLAYHRGNPSSVLTAYTSMCSGFFSRLEREGREAVAGSPYFTEGNLKRFRRLQEIAGDHGATVSEALLGFVLTRRPRMIALAGAGSLAHLKEIMETFRFDFREEEY